MLKKAVDYHLRWNDRDRPQEIVYSPWDRLRDDPRFRAQVGRMETDLEQQALTIRSMLSRHDMDDLIAPLLPAVVGSGSD
jgi:hypothetical protein